MLVAYYCSRSRLCTTSSLKLVKALLGSGHKVASPSPLRLTACARPTTIHLFASRNSRISYSSQCTLSQVRLYPPVPFVIRPLSESAAVEMETPLKPRIDLQVQPTECSQSTLSKNTRAPQFSIYIISEVCSSWGAQPARTGSVGELPMTLDALHIPSLFKPLMREEP